MKAIVYTGGESREVMHFEERPDPAPGSEDLLVAVRFAPLNTAISHSAQARILPAGNAP